MKAYMAYSRGAGTQDGAVLVFHNSAKEARKLSYGHCLNVDEWLDQAVRWERDTDIIFPLANQDKLARGIPHVVDDPVGCENCGYWGCGMYQGRGQVKCNWCMEYPGDKLVEVYLRWVGDM